MATQFEIDLAMMAGVAYRSTRDPKNRLPAPVSSGWSEIVGSHSSLPSGFEAVSFQRGNDIVIAFAGTYPKQGGDIVADGHLLTGNPTDQMREAAQYYCKMREKYGNGAKITLTGHSLGGGLASLVGVFFNEEASTFDQAPFRKSAVLTYGRNLVVEDLLVDLRAKNVSEELLQPLIDFNDNPDILNTRENKITDRCVEGEALSLVPGYDRIGNEQELLTHGSPDLLMAANLHSQTLLIAFLQNDAFRQVTFKLPDLLPMIFDDELYSFPTDEGKENFLARLVRNEFGNAPAGAVDSDMLTRFTEDMEMIAQDGGLTLLDTDLTKTLTAFAMQAYYEDKLGADEKLFNNDGVTGGIHFDRTKVADTLENTKGYEKYFGDVLLAYSASERGAILEKIPGLLDWYLQAGGQAMEATAGSQEAFMMGGKGDDTLTGGAKADVLVGGLDGADTLVGGGGDDYLIGGRGADILKGGDGDDTYFATNGDTITDSDGDGWVHFADEVLTGGKKEKGKEYWEGNGGRYTLSNGTLVFTKGGKSVTIKGYNKSAASLGIQLDEEPPDDPTEPQDFSSPLVLDLNKNNITSTSLYDTNVHFDLDGDGFREKTGWIETGDGLLALDTDHSGAIENGGELFGNYTPDGSGANAAHGFLALARYDSNNDGQMNSLDDIFSSLRVWIDGNGDGVSQADELQTLESLHITSINLASQETSGWEAFNKVKQTSTFTHEQVDENGTVLVDNAGNAITEELAVRDIWFNRDNEQTTYDFTGTVSPTIMALPEMKGQGRVKNLSHAMAEDSELQTLVETFLTQSSNLQTLQTRADELLARWTHSDDIDPAKTRGQQFILNHNYTNVSKIRAFRTYAYARNVAVTESFDGRLFRMNVGGQMTDEVIGTVMAKQMTDKYNALRDGVIINLLSQSLLGKEAYNVETGILNKDLLATDLPIKLQATDPAAKQIAVNLLAALLERDRLSVFDYLDSTVLSNSAVHDLLAQSGINLTLDNNGNVSGLIDGNTYGTSSDDQLSGNGELYGRAGNDSLSGGSGHDSLYGGDGDDSLFGGQGDDILYGDAGNDTLHAGAGYGHDVLIGGRGNDILYGNGRSSTYIYHYGDGNDTIIDPGTIGNSPDILTLRGIVRDDVTVIRDGNDMLLTIRDIASENPAETSGSVRIKNGFGAGKMERFEFEDTILDYTQFLEGSSIYDDVYNQTTDNPIFTIEDVGGTDVLMFADDVTREQLDVRVTGENNITIGIREEGVSFENLQRRITITNDFHNKNRIEHYRFSDGSELDFTGLLNLQQGGDQNDTIRFLSGNHEVDGGAGNDTLFLADGDDILSGGSGDDQLHGGGGSDRYNFNRGDGHDLIFDDSGTADSLHFGSGISATDLLIEKEGSSIIIGLKEADKPISELADTITIENWYNRQTRVESLVFSDGSSWDTSAILSGMSSSGIVYGLEGDDEITGSTGEDIIFGRAGDDTLRGEEGADQLYGESGADTLSGGAGNDNLYGGSGADRYLYSRGDGIDVIDDYSSSSASNSDALVFGPDIDPDDLWIRQTGNDLEIGLAEPDVAFDQLSDRITIHNWFSEASRIEQFIFANGTTHTAGTMIGYLGTTGDDTITGIPDDSIFTDSSGNDRFFGQSGSDEYRFGAGSGHDIITDTNGNDSLVFADGITADQVQITWEQGTNTIVIHYGTDNTITLNNWYLENSRIEKIVFSDGISWTASDIVDRMGTEGDDVFRGLAEVANVIHAKGGDDIVSTFAENDQLYGGAGDDALDGGGGNDILAGGTGNDQLWGGAGDDTYVFKRGDGHDTISDDDKNVQDAGNDRLQFGAGIDKEDLVFKVDMESNDLIVGVIDPARPNTPFAELNDTITLSDWYAAKNRIETFVFTKNGEQMSVSAIMLAMGSDGNDTLKALVEGSVLEGNGGDDIIYGNRGEDILRGGDGNDTLLGGDNSDLLTGGAGDDIVKGGGGNDSYHWGRGDGRDTILDQGTETYYQYGYITTEQGYRRWVRKKMQRSVDGGMDVLLLGDGIAAEDIQVKRENNNIILGIRESGKNFDELSDRLEILDFYSKINQIEEIRFADGTSWHIDKIEELSVLGTTEADSLVGFNRDDVMFGYNGDDTLSGLGGNDSLTGGTGNDTLDGGAGNDTYYFGLGDGQDTINNYDTSNSVDILEFQEGISADSIRIRRVNNDMIVLVGDGEDKITVTNGFLDDGNSAYSLSQIRLSDGTSWDIEELKLRAVSGSDIADQLIGFSQNDQLQGLGGDDYLLGGAGDDTLTGGLGNDTLDGGTGSDTYIFSTGDGQDVINNHDTSANRQDVIAFQEGIEVADVRAQRIDNDLYLHVGNGDDRIVVTDYFIGDGNGGYSVNEVSFSDGTIWTVDKIKELVVLGTTGADLLTGFAQDDLMRGFSGNDTLKGFAGNDQIHGGDGDDEIHGGLGNDQIFGETGADTLYGNEGDDTIKGGAGNDIVDGGAGNDSIFGGLGTDTLNGSTGDDTIYGGAGIDTIHGGADQDTLYGDSGGDLIFGGAGGDIIHGNSDNDTIEGNDGNDTLYGDEGDDTLFGNAGNDLLNGGAGADKMTGGSGNDIYVIDNTGDEVIELADEGYDTVETNLDLTLMANVEKGILTGDDNINGTGNSLNNRLIGNSGNNVLNGMAGTDFMQGGLGDDTYYTDKRSDTISEAADEGIDTEIRSHESNYLLSTNVENLTLAGTIFRGNGNELDNVLTGNDATNNLWGREGNDTIFGLGGDDTIIGDTGNDQLNGGSGNDLLSGGAGNDTLLGGTGNDQLDGGAGTNSLRGGAGDDKYVYRTDGGIYEIDNSDGGTDWLLFTDDLSMDRLSFIKSGDNLIVRVDSDEARQVTVTNWFLGEEYQIDYIQPAGGTGIAASKINRMFPPGNPEADGIVVPAALVFDAKWYGTAEGEQLIGTSGSEIIRGYQGDDNIFAQAGDDWLLGGSGNDFLDGGTGNDTLYGGAGNDRYMFKSGYGHETIDNSGGGVDWLLFDAELTADKLVFTRTDDDLVINITDSEDQITVKNWFVGDEYKIDYIQPGGGTGISAAQIETMIGSSGSTFDTVVDGTDAGEQLVGTAGTNQINGAGGNDQLFGLGGNDELNGGAGNDYLDGGAGDDIINGGAGDDQLGGDAGNDTLTGGTGNDTYVYKAGSGADTINNLGGGTDWLIFNDNITVDRLSYIQSGDDLIVRVDASESSQITVTDWFKGAEYQLSYIQPSGGNGIPASQINALFESPPPPSGTTLEVPADNTFDAIRTGTAAGEQLVGTGGNDLLKGLGGNDQLFGLSGNDWLLGGDGNDYFDGGAGNDTMLGGAGNDQLGGDAGNDIMSGGAGDDKYVYRPGSGADTIINSGGGTDWLLFTGDITADKLSYYRSEDSLLVKIDNSDTNMVTIKDWFKGDDYRVDYIQPSGGNGISASQIEALVEPLPQASAAAPSSASGGDDYFNYRTAPGAPLDGVTGSSPGDGLSFDKLTSEKDQNTGMLFAV